MWLSKECTTSPQSLSKVKVGVFWSQLLRDVFAKGCVCVCEGRHWFIRTLCLKRDAYSSPGFSHVYMQPPHACTGTHVPLSCVRTRIT